MYLGFGLDYYTINWFWQNGYIRGSQDEFALHIRDHLVYLGFGLDWLSARFVTSYKLASCAAELVVDFDCKIWQACN